MTKFQLLTLFTAIGLSGCATSRKAEDMDIKMKPVITNSDAEAPSNIAVKDGAVEYENPASVTPKSVMDWQKFFKPAPSAKDRDVLEAKLKKWPESDSAANLVQKGRTEMALGRYKAAEVSFRTALRKESTNHDALLELSHIYIKQKRMDEAFEFLQDLYNEINLSDEVTTSLVFRYRYALALALISRGDRDKAHGVLSDLIGIDKTFTPAYTALASSYISVDKFEVAKFIAKRALDRAKEHPSLFNILGLIAENEDREVAAMSWYNKAIEMDAAYAPAFVNRANLHMRQFEFDLAKQDLDRAIQADPYNIEAHISLAVAQRKSGKTDQARKTLETAITIDPKNVFARYNLAILMAEDLERPHEAIRLFHEVLQSGNKNPKLMEAAAAYIADLNTKTEQL